MKSNCSFPFYILIFLFTSCAGGSKNGNPQLPIGNISHLVPNDSILIIDLDNAYKRKLCFLSSLMKDVQIIPLECNDNNLIGRISKIAVHDEQLFVLDKSFANSLFIFNKNGSFVRKTGNSGKGPGEYVDISDFTIDRLNNIVYILDSHSQRISRFSASTGEYISSVRIKNDFIRSYRIQLVGNKMYADAFMPSGFTRQSFLLREINMENGEQELFWMSSSQYNKGWNELYFNKQNEFVQDNDVTAKYCQTFMDTVVLITSTGVTPYMAIQSKDLLTNKDLERSSGKPANERFNSLLIGNKILGINNLLEFGNYIYFEFMRGNAVYTVLYDKKQRDICVADALIDDLVYTKDPVNTILPHFYYSDNKGIYGILQLHEFERFHELADKGYLSAYMTKMYDNLKISENSNPIVFYYEYKE